MTLSQALQLYAPLAGLMVVVFRLGVLSNRVATLEREERDRKERDRDGVDHRDKIARLETLIDVASEKMERFERQLDGVHRQLANIATRSGNVSRELLGND